MALQTSLEVKGTLYENAYIKVARVIVDNNRKFAKATIYIYANKEARDKSINNYIDSFDIIIPNTQMPNPNYQPPQYDENGNLIKEAVGEPYLDETYFQRYIDGEISVLKGVYQYLKETRFKNAIDV